MNKPAVIFLAMAMFAMANCQLFNDILPVGRGASKQIFDKTVEFNKEDLSSRPGAKKGYLPPEAATYLPPQAPTYLPPQAPTYLPPAASNAQSAALQAKPGKKPADPIKPPPPTPPPLRSPVSTSGPKYLPPATTSRSSRSTVSYMPTMGTFPSMKPYTYTTSRTTTRRPMSAPSTLSPFTTTTKRATTKGYSYDKPDVAFET